MTSKTPETHKNPYLTCTFKFLIHSSSPIQNKTVVTTLLLGAKTYHFYIGKFKQCIRRTVQDLRMLNVCITRIKQLE